MKDEDDDLIEVVQRALRHSTPELRTQVMECVVGAMVDAGDWGSICWWHGELEHALMEYFRLAGRTEQAVCAHCFNNLGKGLQERLKGRVVVEEARRQG
jgi:hypothetical protein